MTDSSLLIHVLESLYFCQNQYTENNLFGQRLRMNRGAWLFLLNMENYISKTDGLLSKTCMKIIVKTNWFPKQTNDVLWGEVITIYNIDEKR